MKFDKFGVFPKTPSPKNTQSNQLELSSLINLLPSLLSKKQKAEPEKVDNQIQQNQNKKPYSTNNAKAYSDFLQKHNDFVKGINKDKE